MKRVSNYILSITANLLSCITRGEGNLAAWKRSFMGDFILSIRLSELLLLVDRTDLFKVQPGIQHLTGDRNIGNSGGYASRIAVPAVD